MALYVATINVPGYLPMDDEPPVFETARDAWQYLVGEVERAWDDYPADDNGACVEAHTQLHIVDQNQPGTVYAPTPGYDGDHDLGLAYSVTELEDDDRRIYALAMELGYEAHAYTPADYGEHTYTDGGAEYLVLTDEEATKAAHENVEESLWAFVPDFLASETGIDVEVFRAIQANNRCEDNTPAIRSIVDGTCGFEELADEAIQADGRGHFLAHYDSEELELVDGLYAYRVN